MIVFAIIRSHKDEVTKGAKLVLSKGPKTFFKKNYSRFRNRNKQGNYNSEKPKDESFKNSCNEDEKK